MKASDLMFTSRTTVTRAVMEGKVPVVSMVEDEVRQKLAAHIVNKRVRWEHKRLEGLSIAELQVYVVTPDELDMLVHERLKAMSAFEIYNMSRV